MAKSPKPSKPEIDRHNAYAHTLRAIESLALSLAAEPGTINNYEGLGAAMASLEHAAQCLRHCRLPDRE